MKKNLFYLFAIICSIGLFTACSSDDDNDGVASEIVGDYAGAMSVTSPQGQLPSVDQTVYVTTADPDNVNIQLMNFTVATFQMGNISAKCAVVKAGNNYTLNGSTKVPVASLGGIEVPVSIQGTVNGQQLTLSITVTGVGVTANFNGSK